LFHGNANIARKGKTAISPSGPATMLMKVKFWSWILGFGAAGLLVPAALLLHANLTRSLFGDRELLLWPGSIALLSTEGMPRTQAYSAVSSSNARAYDCKLAIQCVMRFAAFLFVSVFLLTACETSSGWSQPISSSSDSKKEPEASATSNPLFFTPFDELKKRPGVKITADGKTLLFPGGVSISDVTDSGVEKGISGTDNSGHGAVLCGWELFLSMKAQMALCRSNTDAAFSDRLDKAINRINKFIVANSLSPVTNAEVQRQSTAFIAAKEHSASKEEVQKECTSGDFAKGIRAYQSMPPSAFDHAIDDMLSVPRPPVLAPCL
jgi:hypothetical protein